MNNYVKFLSSFFICFLPAILGGFFTKTGLTEWYDFLHKPVFNPPDWIFAPVWTTLYFLMGISLFLILKAPNSKTKNLAVTFFALQLTLNGLWSYVFFSLHNILGAFFVIILLIIFLILSILNIYPINKTAAFIQLPYLFWILFASILNYSIYILNK